MPSSSTLEVLKYNPKEVRPGVIHIGIGNFARAFIGHYFNKVAENGHKNWGVVAVAPSDRQKLELNKLTKQGHLYTLIQRNGYETCTPIGAIRQVMIGKESADHVIKRMAGDDIKLVTLTVTQAGYCLDATNNFVVTPEIQHEIDAIKDRRYDSVKTAPGWIAAAMYERFLNKKPLFTVLSCDNLPRNGDMTANVIKSFAQNISPEFYDYVQTEAAFPNSVVDRITPHQNFEKNEVHLRTKHDATDSCAVLCEPYIKWYIEDTFTKAGRPPLDEAGVLFVPSIAPYEDMKLRLLNGSHMVLGIMSKILQIPTVYEAVHDADLKAFWHHFLDQASEPLKTATMKSEVESYAAATIERLENPHLTDHIDRLLAATTSKVRPRLFNLPALMTQANENGGLPYDASSFAIAAWLRYMQGRDASGNPYNLHQKDTGHTDRFGQVTPDVARLNLAQLLSKNEVTSSAPETKKFLASVIKDFNLIEDVGLREALRERFSPLKRPAPTLSTGAKEAYTNN